MGKWRAIAAERFILALLPVALACGATSPLRLDDGWPKTAPDYRGATERWTRRTTLSSEYQESLDLVAIFKSAEWRAAHAERDADHRGLTGPARDGVLAQAKAEWEGPYEIELLVSTWDRRENDLDRGKRSVWHIALVDDAGQEHEPIEIVKDKRAPHILRAEFPTLGDFATAYVARFERSAITLDSSTRAVRLRMSSERGGVELVWAAH